MTLTNKEQMPRAKKERFQDLTNQDKEMIDFSQLRALKHKEVELQHSEPLMMKYVKKTGINRGINKLKDWTNDFDDGESINSETKKKLENGEYLKRYRSCQAFFFHFAMMLISCYVGVMFVGWIHISV